MNLTPQKPKNNHMEPGLAKPPKDRGIHPHPIPSRNPDPLGVMPFNNNIIYAIKY